MFVLIHLDSIQFQFCLLPAITSILPLSSTLAIILSPEFELYTVIYFTELGVYIYS